MNNADVIKLLYSTLKPVQQKMFSDFFKSTSRKYVIHCARRLGKTYLLCVISSCVALSKPNAQIRYATFTQKALKKMILPIFTQLFNKLPESFKPKFNTTDGTFTFANGSTIHLAGVNNGHSDSLRGTAADLALVDEAGFIDELSYLNESVLIPQLLTVQDSKLIMASSSPLSPAHEFVEYINQAKLNNFYSSYTIYDGNYPADLIAEFCNESGGESSTTWKREYLNHVITDETLAIIPEWDKKYVVDYSKSEFYPLYHKYCAADWGVRDKTALLWGFYDFKNGSLVIEDEWSCSGQDSTTRNIASNIKAKELNLNYTTLYRRVADNNQLILLQDLGSEFNIHFSPTSKDTLSAMLNEVRLWVGSGRLIVHQRCVELIQCLEFGVFANSKRSEFGRSKALGHYDMLAALTYFIRNIDQSTNPIPNNYNTNIFTHFTPPSDEHQHHEIRKLFNF